MTRAGLPTATTLAGTSPVTTEPAPMTLLFPMLIGTASRVVRLWLVKVRSPIDSWSRSPRTAVA